MTSERGPRRLHRYAVRTAAALLVLAVVAGCAATSAGAPAGPSGGERLTVLAAASLSGAFDELAAGFERTHPGVTVALSYGASSTLATQVISGAPADVFASASAATMQPVSAAGLTAAPPVVVATNALQIAVPPANRAGIAALADLARPGVKLAVCQPEAPCGAAAEQLLATTGLAVRPVTEESDVKATLAKVILGEVDAGLVYVTDVRAASGAVTGIAIPDAVNATTSYPIAALAGSRNPALAQRFVDHVRSAEGRRVLTAHGFGAP